MRAPAGGALEDRLREGPLTPAQAERSGLSRISRSVRSVRTSFRSRRSCAHSSVSVPSGRWSGPHIHDVLSAILRTAVKWDHLVDNPAQGVDLPRLVTVRLKWALAVPQAANLLEALPALPKTLVGIALLTGVRRGELFALRWRDLDISRQCLIIREAVYVGTFSTPKTTAGLRTIPLSSLATKLAQTWRRQARRTGANDLMFGTRTGKPISPNNVLRRWIRPATVVAVRFHEEQGDDVNKAG